MAKIDLEDFIRRFPENGMKRMLENTKNLHDFLKIAAAVGDDDDKKLIGELNPRKLTLLNTTFVKPDFRHVLSDLFILAAKRWRRRETLRGSAAIYILIEHQSAPQRLMPLRTSEYVIQAYSLQERAWEKDHPPGEEIRFDLVFPIVFFTGAQSWTRPNELFELVRDGVSYKKYIPGIDALYVNLPELAADMLTAQGGPFGELLKLVQGRTTDAVKFYALLGDVISNLEETARREQRRWLEFISYIHAMIRYERSPQEQKRFTQVITESVKSAQRRKEVVEMIKSGADALKEEGKKEGKKEGLAEGELNARRSTLLRLLRHRFGKVPAKKQQIINQSQNPAQLDKWLDRVLDVQSWQDMEIE